MGGGTSDGKPVGAGVGGSASPYNTNTYVLPLAIFIFGGLNENVSVLSATVDRSNVQIGE